MLPVARARNVTDWCPHERTEVRFPFTCGMATTRSPSHGSEPGIHAELGPAGAPLLVAFGGMVGDGDPTLFEFDRLTRGLDAQRCLLRDHHRAWYHHGVRGVGDDLAAVEARLRQIVAEARPVRVVMVGVSTGGYAAMLLGHRVGADTVHAFSPQTYLDPVLRRRHREPRWERETAALIGSGRYDATALDLGTALPGATGGDRRPDIHLWYSPGEQPDATHAARVAHLPRLRLHCVPHGDHLLVKWLRDAGHLEPILTSALDGGPVPDIPDEIAPRLRQRPTRRYLLRRRWWMVKHRRRARRAARTGSG